MAGRVTRSRAKDSRHTAGATAPASAAVRTASATSTDDPPPKKRVKKSKALSESSRQRRKGRLSILPTLPLDVLYEIFGHLQPADLLNLCRTNKAVRGLLLSNQCAFMWREVLDAAAAAIEGYPTRPSDMSEPSFTLLMHGGPWCLSCGARTANKPMWNLRRKVCTDCAETHLIARGPTVSGIVSLMRYNVLDVDVLPSDLATTEDSYKREVPHFWEDDVLAYQAELQSLRNDPAKRDNVWELHTAVDERRSQEVKAREEFAERCIEFEERRQDDRHLEIIGLKKARFKEIENRLQVEGYAAVDINDDDVRDHKEVANPKRMTDRVWLRVGPIVREIVENIRDERLERERQERRTLRRNMISEEYTSYLRQVDPHATSFLPTPTTIFRCPGITDILADDREPDDEMREAIRRTLDGLSPIFLSWLSSRVDCQRKILPTSWPSPPTFEEVSQNILSLSLTDPLFQALPTTLGPLDLAAHVFRCKHATLMFPMRPSQGCKPRLYFGLEALAHQCPHDLKRGFGDDADILSIVPSQSHHEDLCEMLQLLGYDPLHTTPRDLDQTDQLFVCTACAEKRSVCDWRDMLSHRSHSSKCGSQRHTIRVLTEQEERYISLCLLAHRRRDPIEPHRSNAPYAGWGCPHCYAHLQLPSAHELPSYAPDGHWFLFDKIKAHLRTEHGITAPQEGEDMFLNRRFEFHSYRRLIIPSAEYAVKEGADILERYANDKNALSAPPANGDTERFEKMSPEDLDILCDAVGLFEKYWRRQS
ncbi:hypothetical protein PENSPDRAFT_617888 [Peniophora sp. CONT]|nr:hypothetical protein PENSPDRAFT_617888 [Peniophora sp. CONT]